MRIRRLTDFPDQVNVLIVDNKLATCRERRCRECGSMFESIRLGQRGAFPGRCPSCVQKERRRIAADKRARRAAASAHLCRICGGTIHGNAVYCKSKKCQRARTTAKQHTWASKPDVKKHLAAKRKRKSKKSC